MWQTLCCMWKTWQCMFVLCVCFVCWNLKNKLKWLFHIACTVNYLVMVNKVLVEHRTHRSCRAGHLFSPLVQNKWRQNETSEHFCTIHTNILLLEFRQHQNKIKSDGGKSNFTFGVPQETRKDEFSQKTLNAASDTGQCRWLAGWFGGSGGPFTPGW